MLRKYFRTSFLFSVLFFVMILVLGLPLASKAQLPPSPTSIGIDNPLKATTFDELVADIAKWIWNIAVSLAVVVFMWGGFQFLVSGGDEKKVETAKKTMTWGAVGLGICLIGRGFVELIKQFFEGTSF